MITVKERQMIISLIAEQPLITYKFFNQKKRSETSSFLLFLEGVNRYD